PVAVPQRRRRGRLRRVAPVRSDRRRPFRPPRQIAAPGGHARLGDRRALARDRAAAVRRRLSPPDDLADRDAADAERTGRGGRGRPAGGWPVDAGDDRRRPPCRTPAPARVRVPRLRPGRDAPGPVADRAGVVHEIVPPRESPPINDREYFIEAMQNRRMAVSDVILGRLSHVPIVTIAVPIVRAGGEMAGVAGGSLDLSQFERFVADYKTLADARITIVDQHDRVIYTSGRTGFSALQSLAKDELVVASARARGFAGAVTRPLEEVVRVVRNISAHGGPAEARLTSNPPAEIAGLLEDVNGMQTRLADSYQRLEQALIQRERLNTELRALTEDL